MLFSKGMLFETRFVGMSPLEMHESTHYGANTHSDLTRALLVLYVLS